MQAGQSIRMLGTVLLLFLAVQPAARSQKLPPNAGSLEKEREPVDVDVRANPPPVIPQDLPAEAGAVVEEYQRAARTVQVKAEAELKPFQEKAIQRLKTLQDQYTRAAKLDQALAVRDAIRVLRNILPDPGVLRASAQEIGQALLFEVTGSTTDSIWGTEVYTTDSYLGAAAVHAGLLKPGQKGVVKVRILPGQKSYAASTRNGVTSQSWGPWGVSFTFELCKDCGL